MSKSLRRELQDQSVSLRLDEKADLSTVDRAALEEEVLRLRAVVNKHSDAHHAHEEAVRDILSHTVTGKSDEYLQLNATEPKEKKPELKEILYKAGQRALGGGLPGAAAMGIQVASLMWLRTTMNYQYRHGTSTTTALRTLWREGGVVRFYRGVGPALIQGPMSRFGDTAANAGTLALLDSYEATMNLPVAVKTAFASGSAALWRINLMPVDTLKTIMQVEGRNGIPMLMAKFRANGPRVFYSGALAAASSTFVGHWPRFFTHNFLQERIPQQNELHLKLLRNAGIGFCSSFVSDCTSNSIRVVKTTKQTSEVALSYVETVQLVVKEDGIIGLFGRGLRTRLLANGVQGMMFTVLWKFMEEKMRNWQDKEVQK